MLTDREKKLVSIAYEAGFLDGEEDYKNGFSNKPMEQRIEDWLNDTVADSGGTVDQYISWAVDA